MTMHSFIEQVHDRAQSVEQLHGSFWALDTDKAYAKKIKDEHETRRRDDQKIISRARYKKYICFRLS